MIFLIIGSTGTLGRALSEEILRRGYEVIGAARSGTDKTVDISAAESLTKLLEETEADVVINCAATVNLSLCEEDPGLAYLTNARPASIIADHCNATQTKLVQISTDHFFSSGGNHPHSELEPIVLANEYARTKYIGELLAARCVSSLVVRTSFLGFTGSKQTNLAFWAFDAVRASKRVKAFTDAFTSSLDVYTCAKTILDLIDLNTYGTYNIGSSEVYSKADLIIEIAKQLSLPDDHIKPASVSDLPTTRANCLGLDVSKAENRLNYNLPTMKEVVQNLISQYEKGSQK